MPRTQAEFQTRELKPEQAAAARTLNCHVSVTAGPGAGKTTVLVERYLEILRTQKVSVDNIVAITFTNRAANEMRVRVRKQIDLLLSTLSDDERRRWLRHKRSLDGAVITTIHGFCSRLLREFPVEAQIDPQFILLDEHQAAMLLEAVVDEALADAIHRGNEKIIHLAQGTSRAALAGALVELHRKYRGEGLPIEAIEKLTAANHASRSDYEAALSELDTSMAELLSAHRLSKAAEEKRARASQDWPALRAILAEPPDEKQMAGYCQSIEDFWDARPNKGSHRAVEQLDQLLWGEKASRGDCLGGQLPAIGFDLLAREYSLAQLKLLREIDRRLDSEKQRLSVLDFDDLQLRALKLLSDRPEVLSRVTQRYRFFLVDEFQDTNGLQRDLMKQLALGRGANLFIVGDRKQSVYGFRGADVDVFREMTAAIEAAGGTQQPLQRNFRSQKPLIDSLNFLFARIFRKPDEIRPDELAQLGFVEHEASVAERDADHKAPLVELLVTVLPDKKHRGESETDEQDESGQLGAREYDADQLVERIRSLVDPGDDSGAPTFKYGDIAILFRALTGVGAYETALRRAGIPFLTVQGKGFYQREEITDLIQLLRFLDNTTDELALAAVLRSPLCGISDNALLALRCAPRLDETDPHRLHRRKLLRALRRRKDIAFIDDDERVELDRASEFLDSLIQRRNRYGIAELLRFAVASSEFMTVIATHFDGAQRITNVEKLFRLAEQFEKSNAHLIRDFVHYVEEFEATGGRESEGQMDESADVVRLMTIHQAKGLEFKVVIIPDLPREPRPRDTWYVLDRHKGLTVSVPDGRGQTVRGALLNQLRRRARRREEFEGMRLLYVAATRAEDRLILSGAIAQKELKNLSETKREQWLAWIWQALELDEHARSAGLKFADEVEFQVTVDRDPQTSVKGIASAGTVDAEAKAVDLSRPLTELFPLLQPIAQERGRNLRRFSVTQLINFQRCARQYYFDRLLRTPGAEELAVWNDADAPEPPANLTATLKGAVIHRFCETFTKGDDATTRLRQSYDDVVSQRKAELAGRPFAIDPGEAVHDLMPLAQNYLASEVFKRVSEANRVNGETLAANPHSGFPNPQSGPGLWSELRFRLRRNLGILTGTIDKLLITPAANGDGFDVEIIDFKTNRFKPRPEAQVSRARSLATVASQAAAPGRAQSPLITGMGSPPAQARFDFESPIVEAAAEEPKTSLDEQIDAIAHDYQLQMQSYALAIRELLGYRAGSGPGSPRGQLAWGGGCDRVNQSPESPLEKEFKIHNLRATLHFIDPNAEVSLSSSLLTTEACAGAIDSAMLGIASLDGTLDPELFPPNPATHCRICSFLDLCPAGQLSLNQHRSR